MSARGLGLPAAWVCPRPGSARGLAMAAILSRAARSGGGPGSRPARPARASRVAATVPATPWRRASSGNPTSPAPSARRGSGRRSNEAGARAERSSTHTPIGARGRRCRPGCARHALRAACRGSRAPARGRLSVRVRGVRVRLDRPPAGAGRCGLAVRPGADIGRKTARLRGRESWTGRNFFLPLYLTPSILKDGSATRPRHRFAPGGSREGPARPPERGSTERRPAGVRCAGAGQCDGR